MIRTKTLLSLCIGLALCGTPATAKEPKSKKGKSEAATNVQDTEIPMPRTTRGHQPHDLNGDGVVTRKEWPGNDESFAELDRDGNGVLNDRDRPLAGNENLDRIRPERSIKDKAQKRK